MKTGPVDLNLSIKRNLTTSKQFDDDTISANYDIIFIFTIYGQFLAIQKPDSRCMVHNSHLFVTNNNIWQKLRTELKTL